MEFMNFLFSYLISYHAFFLISYNFHIFRSVFGDAAVEKVRPDMGGGGGGGSGYAGGCAQMESRHESGNSFLLFFLTFFPSFSFLYFFSSFLLSFFLFICLFIYLHICIYHSLICTCTTTHRCTHRHALMCECSLQFFLRSQLPSSSLPLQFEFKCKLECKFGFVFECRCDGRQQERESAWRGNLGKTMTLRNNSISIVIFN